MFKKEGRLIILATLGGTKADEADLRKILTKWLTVKGSTLRARDLKYQINLTQKFSRFALDKFESGKLKPVVDKIFNWKDAAEAHKFMEANKNTGKLILRIE